MENLCVYRNGFVFILKYLDNWLDEKTLVVIIEGNLYSPQTSSMISFVLIIEKNHYGMIDKDVFIEVSDYTLTTIDDRKGEQNDTEQISESNHNNENQLMITHYLFAVLLFFIVSIRN